MHKSIAPGSANAQPAIAAILDGFPGQWCTGALMEPAHATLRQALALWDAARGDYDMPPGEALTPRQLKFALPDMHIYVVSPETPRYRVKLIGTRFEEFTGRGLAGKVVDEVQHPTLRLAMSRILQAVEAGRAPLHIKAPRAIALPNGDQASLESLWLPCAADHATIDRVIAISLLGAGSAA